MAVMANNATGEKVLEKFDHLRNPPNRGKNVIKNNSALDKFEVRFDEWQVS